MPTIKDNFLSKGEFDRVCSFFSDPNTAWQIKHGIASEKTNNLDDYFFCHMVYGNLTPQSPFFPELITMLSLRFTKHLIARIKCNLYTRTNEVVKHTWHIDDPNLTTLKGALLMLNTCDGYTGFEDGTKVESVANRMIFFDALKPHHSTSTSNASTRLTLNINYI